MKEALGKWLMDIAKYMVTAILLSSFFNDMTGNALLAWAISASVFCLVIGLALLPSSEEKGKKRNNKKRK